MADIDRFDLLFLIYNIQINRRPRGLRFKEIMEICNCDPQGKKGDYFDSSRPTKCSYRTLINYLRELMAGNWLKKKIDTESGRPLYYVPRRQFKKVDGLKTKRDFHKFADSLDPRWFVPLRNLVKEIEKEEKDPYRVFNEYCFAFIGDEPIAFSKGYAEHIMALDRRIRTGYSREFDACMERCMGDKRTSQSIGACLPVCREEIGNTVGEYWRKLKKKAEKLPFPQRMWVAEGYTDEEIEKMLDDIKKQERYREKS